MDDLLQSQIHESCRLALPEGLKDLMSDISREVLRAQPKDLLKFITEYLAALLVTREHLITSSRICDNICTDMCALGFEDELRQLGIADDDIKIVKELVDVHFKDASPGIPVKEGHLMSKIMRNTTVSPEQITDIQEAVRKAFLRYQAYNTTIYEMTPDESLDDITRAAYHTLDLFRKTKPSDDEYHAAATKIQAAYRAYGVRRQMNVESNRTDWSYAPDVMNRAGLEDTLEIDTKFKQHHITFDSEGHTTETLTRFADSQSMVTDVSEKTEDIYVSPERNPKTASSTSLAGSYLHLPKFKPYTVHEDDVLKENEEPMDDAEVEKQQEELLNIDYTREKSKEIEVTEAIRQLGDYESDDINSSIEEEIQFESAERKVVIVSKVEIHDDMNDDEGEEVIEDIVEEFD